MEIETIKKFILKNTNLLFNLFLVVGAVVFAFYFASIAYMPNLDISSSITLGIWLSVISATFIIMVIALMAITIYSAYIWRIFYENDATLPFVQKHQKMKIVIFIAECY